jgi:hypothetical protein
VSQNVPDFQDELTAFLTTALVAETSLLVRFGFPTEVPTETERLYVSPSSNYRLGGGEQFREESFAIGFVVEVFMDGDRPADANRRRWELIDLVDTALYADDFHGYATQGLTLAVEDELVAFDKGHLARSQCTIGAHDEV